MGPDLVTRPTPAAAAAAAGDDDHFI